MTDPGFKSRSLDSAGPGRMRANRLAADEAELALLANGAVRTAAAGHSPNRLILAPSFPSGSPSHVDGTFWYHILAFEAPPTL